MGTSPCGWTDDELERIDACPVCKSEHLLSVYRNLTDLEEGVPGTWSMLKCKGCGSLLLDPRPTRTSLSKAYGSYYTHRPPVDENSSLDGGGLLKRVARAYLAHKYNIGLLGPVWMLAVAYLAWPFRQQLDYYLRHLPRGGGRLLDLGCGNGGFLQRAKEAGWTVVGVEPDPKAALIARQSTNAEVHASIEQITGPFDVITMAHVIEHLHSPAEVLADCHRRLRPGGRLWIATPNIMSMGHRLYGKDWQPLETPRHLVMPSPSALASLLRDAGFEDIRFLRRGRGSGKRLRASCDRAGVKGKHFWMVGPLTLFVDFVSSLNAGSAEELVISASRSTQ